MLLVQHMHILQGAIAAVIVSISLVQSSSSDLLSLYERRDYSGFEQGLRAAPDLITIVDAALAGPASSRLKAGLVMELGAELARRSDPRAAVVLERGCREARRSGEAFNRLWQEAVLTIPLPAWVIDGHVGHQRNGVSRGLMALLQAISAEQGALEAARSRLLALEGSADPMAGGLRALSSSTVQRALDALNRVASEHPEFRFEADIRRANILSQLGRNEDALGLLDRVHDDGTDPWLSYLRQVFRGRALLSLQYVDRAIDGLRESLTLFPQGSTALVLLSAALAEQGDMDGAASTARQVVGNPVQHADPWRTYFSGNQQRHWSVRQAGVRGAAQ